MFLGHEPFFRQIEVDKLVAGDVLTDNIYIENGALLVAAGREMTDQMIAKLQQMGPRVVRIDLRKMIDRSMALTEQLMKKAMQGQVITVREVETIIQPFVIEANRETNVLRLLANLQEQDNYTFQHTVSIGVLASVIGRWLGFGGREISELAVAGTLHDIGKSQVPAKIIHKPGPLTASEYEVVQQHSLFGYSILSNSNEYGDSIRQAVLEHHERNDGSGYPNKLDGSTIHPYAKIIAVADVYHAMTSRRPYKDMASPFVVMSHLKASLDTLDSIVVLKFIQSMVNYLMGSTVLLSDGTAAKVIYVDTNDLAHPTVQSERGFIDLKRRTDLEIRRVVAVSGN